MARIDLDSTVLAWVRYLPEQRVLQIGLRTGNDYEYFDVPPRTFRELLASESKGRYYNSHIRKGFQFSKLQTRSATGEN